jgi:hypothetical protein
VLSPGGGRWVALGAAEEDGGGAATAAAAPLAANDGTTLYRECPDLFPLLGAHARPGTWVYKYSRFPMRGDWCGGRPRPEMMRGDGLRGRRARRWRRRSRATGVATGRDGGGGGGVPARRRGRNSTSTTTASVRFSEAPLRVFTKPNEPTKPKRRRTHTSPPPLNKNRRLPPARIGRGTTRARSTRRRARSRRSPTSRGRGRSMATRTSTRPR